MVLTVWHSYFMLGLHSVYKSLKVNLAWLAMRPMLRLMLIDLIPEDSSSR